MAEPTGSSMPTTYDDADTLLGDLVDQRNLILDTTVDDDDTEIIVTGNVSDIPIPVYVAFIDGEVIYCDTRRGGNDGWTGAIRGARGTTAAGHTAGDLMWCPLTGKHLALMRDALIAAETYQGRYDIVANKGSAVIGEVFVASDEDFVYFGFGVSETPTWVRVGRIKHDELESLDVDGHSQYHIDSRALTWHDGLAGKHVQDGDAHTHLKGVGFGRVVGGVVGSRPAPTYEREVYYATDEKTLYISPDGAAWVALTGAVVDVIAWLTETSITGHGGACPTGWSRFTALDSRFPIGAPAGVTEGLGNLGADTHAHTYSAVIEHLHVVPAQGPTSSMCDTHRHSVPYGYSAGSGLKAYSNATSSNVNVTYSGAHTHVVTVPARVTLGAKRTSDDADGIAEGTASTEDNIYAHHTVIFCQKD